MFYEIFPEFTNFAFNCTLTKYEETLFLLVPDFVALAGAVHNIAAVAAV